MPWAGVLPDSLGNVWSTASELIFLFRVKNIPAERQARFDEVAVMIDGFGREHLDAELTGYVIELWARLCRKKDAACLRGKPEVWAATVAHVIARMNFLFDRAQPVHLTFDTLCDHFHVKKTTIGNKASQVERQLRLRQHAEPGLCRNDLLEQFTMIQFSNGIVLPFGTAKKPGYIPPDERLEDLR